uniref:DoxX family protein n=1 Tax=Alistipes sp. TaxID=1872444 RepID=UPI004055CA62
MAHITRFFFPVEPHERNISLLLLALRLLMGGLLLAHGLDKWLHFSILEPTFPDPLAVGSRFSLMLCIFAEVFCAALVIVGFLTRLALIPIVLNMLIALLVIHHGTPFMARELPFIYLVIFLILMIMGPGCYSIDAAIGRHTSRRISA